MRRQEATVHRKVASSWAVMLSTMCAHMSTGEQGPCLEEGGGDRAPEGGQLLGGHAIRLGQHGDDGHLLGQAGDELAVHRLEPVRPAGAQKDVSVQATSLSWDAHARPRLSAALRQPAANHGMR